MSQLLYQIALTRISGVGNKAAKQLVSYCGSAENVFKSSNSQLLKIPRVGKVMASAILNESPLKEAEQIIEECQKNKVEITSYYSENYPKNLKQAIDSPMTLFYQGNIQYTGMKMIAIVGTRKATNYGKMITEQIVKDLANYNVCIVSGLAYGIDIEAHKSALKYNLPTIGIVAGGLDKIYPSTHKKYANEMITKGGGVITENKLGRIPEPHLFPARNRIIAGISDVTIVVEAAAKGGALITANIADSYNRPVFAIPGNVGNQYSEGTNKLISSQKAIIYTGVNDLMKYMNWDISPENNSTNITEIDLQNLSNEEMVIYELLRDKGEPIEIDLIAIQTNIPINQVAATLLNLEFQNLIKSLPGKKYTLI